MKALSIKQPWASLISHGIKNIENRTWKTHFRGKIYIHSSADKKQYPLFTREQNNAMYNYNLGPVTQPKIVSAIIGEVEIIDCVINHQSIWAEKTEVIGKTIEGDSLYRGQIIYNWVLANPILYDKPILNVKGKLSFWEFEKPVRKYQPSNGTDGMVFCEKFCNQCAHEKFTHTQNFDDKQCELFSNSLIYDVSDEEYPKEWIYDNAGLPTCTNFKKHIWHNETGDLTDPVEPEPIDPNQLGLF